MDGNKLIRCAAVLMAATVVLAGCTAKKQPERFTTEPVTESTTAETAVTVNSTEQTILETETTAAQTEAVTSEKATSASTAAVTSAASVAQRQSTLLKNLKAANAITGYFFIKNDEVNHLARNIADSSKIYYVRLNDGTKTYYMAVDLTTAQALSLANRDVLLEVCRQLDKKQQAGKGSDWVLMDYTHLVGELELHFIGYLLTGALGGESGPLAKFYRSCKVADLNVDENRFGELITIIGTVYG